MDLHTETLGNAGVYI